MPDLDDDRRKMMKPRRRFRFLLEFAFAKAWTTGLRLLPRTGALFWGTFLGFFAYFLLRHDRRVAMANLDVVFGNRISPGRKRELALQTFVRLGETVMSLLWAPRLTARSSAYWVDTRDLQQILAKLKVERRGAIIVTPHYGDWEIGCIACGFAGYPMTSVAEPLANQRLERLFTECRTCSGNSIIAPKYALLKLVRALRKGHRVGLLCDVNGRRGRGGVWNDFFGLPTYNGVAMAELALRTEAALVFVAVEPAKDGRHRVVPTLVEPQSTRDHADDVRRLTQQVTDLVAAQIRRNPAPWLWTYKRWKRRPREDRGAFPFYSNYKRVE